MESLDHLDLGLDFGSLSLPPPPEELDALFLDDEEIDSIDDGWWQAIEEPVSEGFVGDGGGDGGVAGVAAPSSSCSSPTPTVTSELDLVSTPSESGTKRSAVSSPDSDHDDPKRTRRLEKNREAASQSRARKKSYVKELEVKCRMLEAHVAQLQRVMTVTSMENSALKDELVRVKKPKDSVKTGVAEPAVLESNSLPSEFLRHYSCHYPTVHQVPSRTGGQFPRFLHVLLQLLILAAVSGSSGPQTRLPQSPLREGMSDLRALEGAVVVGRNPSRRKRSRHDLTFRWATRPPGSKRRKVKRIRSTRIL